MDALTLVITILQLLCGLAVIVIVLFQSGKSAGLSGAIGGVADSFLSRNKAKTLDAKLARATKWVGAIFLILTLVLLILQGRFRAESARCAGTPGAFLCVAGAVQHTGLRLDTVGFQQFLHRQTQNTA